MEFKNGINNIQTTAYNDACTLYINGSPIVESYESFIDILSNLLRLVVKLSLENAKHKWAFVILEKMVGVFKN